MSRAFFLSILTLSIFIFGLVIGDARILSLCIPLLAFAIVGYVKAPNEISLTVQRKLSAERVHLGEDVRVTLTINNPGDVIEEVMLEDVLPEGLKVVEGSIRFLARLEKGGSVTWEYTVSGNRGYYMLHEVKAMAMDPLGLSIARGSLTTDGQLFIVPPVLRLRRVSIRPRRTRIYSGTIPARNGGPGVEFFDVREYQTGDSPRSINWHATARHHNNIFSNQYEQERVVDVGIILDGRRYSTQIGERSIFEHSVMATAALVDAFLSAGNRVGLLFVGKQIHWTLPGYGKVQREKILHSLSRLEPSESQSFNNLYIPRRIFPEKSQLVLVSSMTIDDFASISDLRSRGYAVMVINPDPLCFEAFNLPPAEANSMALRILKIKQQLFINRLRWIGVQVVNWDVSQPFELVARRELERHQTSLRRGL